MRMCRAVGERGRVALPRSELGAMRRWASGYWQDSCAANEAVTGLSSFPQDGAAHAAYCSRTNALAADASAGGHTAGSTSGAMRLNPAGTGTLATTRPSVRARRSPWGSTSAAASPRPSPVAVRASGGVRRGVTLRKAPVLMVVASAAAVPLSLPPFGTACTATPVAGVSPSAFCATRLRNPGRSRHERRTR